jgi:tRNA A-37 threonylcarbamoyl transferase component Bud32
LVTELSSANAAVWLIRHGEPAGTARFEELGGGVSNKVILVEAPRYRAVLKQSLGKLRVEREWLSDRDRIFREAAAMRWAHNRVRGGRVPRVLFEDREDFVIAMESAPAGAETWKTRLFGREFDPDCARAAGAMLGSLIAASWHDPEAQRIFGDQTVFEQLRIDPYYRFTARMVPEFAGYFNDLIGRSAARSVSLVHGDWSPKNLLVAPDAVWAIDWEVIHFGDPSFDAGFLLNHLLLKSIAMPRRQAELAHLAALFTEALGKELPPGAVWVPAAALEHLPALLLARVDGKSPAEYLDVAMRDRARNLAKDLMRHPAASLKEVFAR